MLDWLSDKTPEQRAMERFRQGHYIDEDAHRAKWNEDTWGMTPEAAAVNKAAESDWGAFTSN